MMVYTLGYQLRDIDDYVRAAKEAGTDVVLDVRENAWSRKPGFSKSSLTENLNAVGISYAHASFVGNPKRFRNGADTYRECLKKYEGYIYAKPGLLDEFNALMQKFVNADRKVCLLCYERHPHDCHRSLLIDAWRKRYEVAVEIRHLGIGGAPRLMDVS